MAKLAVMVVLTAQLTVQIRSIGDTSHRSAVHGLPASTSSVLNRMTTLRGSQRRPVSESSPVAQPSVGPRPMTLTWDGTGDFGPQTPGTRTDGWQEALNYCAGLLNPCNASAAPCARTRYGALVRGYNIELQVQGGGGVYNLHETLQFPPFQDFQLDGGVYILNWAGNGSSDAVVVDSLMNVHLELGTVVYGGTGAGLRLRPKRPVGDGFPIITESRISLLNGIADPTPFTAGPRKQGNTGLMFDSTFAPIIDSQINIESVLNFDVNIADIGTKGTNNNQIHLDHLHTNAVGGTLWWMSSAFSSNWVHTGQTAVDQGASNVSGFVIHGNDNRIELCPAGCSPAGVCNGFADGMVQLCAEAVGNTIAVLADGATAAGIVVDEAADATNLITWTGGAPPAARVVRASIPQQPYRYTQRNFHVTMIVEYNKSLPSGPASLVCSAKRRMQSIHPRMECMAMGQVLLAPGDVLTIESQVSTAQLNASNCIIELAQTCFHCVS